MSKSIFDKMVDGGVSPPPLPPSPIFARAAARHKQKLQGNDFCSGKWDFPTQKSSRPRRTRRRVRLKCERAWPSRALLGVLTIRAFPVPLRVRNARVCRPYLLFMPPPKPSALRPSMPPLKPPASWPPIPPMPLEPVMVLSNVTVAAVSPPMLTV